MDKQPEHPSDPGKAANGGSPFLGDDVDNFHSGLRLLAAWAMRERGAVRVGDLLDSMEAPASRSAELDCLWRNLRGFELRSLVDLTEADADLNRSIDDLQTVVGPRQIEILRQRKLEGWTLAEVGRNLDLTRERVWQLQQKSELLLSRAMQRDELRWLRIRAHDLRSKLGLGASVGHAATFNAMETALTGVSSDISSEAAAPYRQLWQAVEHRIARLVQLGLRQAHHVGRQKTAFQLHMTATVANLTRILAARPDPNTAGRP